MPAKRQNPVFLSQLAVEGYTIIAQEFNFQGVHAISKILTTFAEAGTEFLDERPDKYKEFDAPTLPKIWNTGDKHTRRDLGLLPVDYLIGLGRIHSIEPYKNQLRAMIGGLSKTPWQVRWTIGRFSSTAKISPVIEAIGLRWLTPVVFPDIDTTILHRREKDRTRATRSNRKWVGAPD